MFYDFRIESTRDMCNLLKEHSEQVEDRLMKCMSC